MKKFFFIYLCLLYLSFGGNISLHKKESILSSFNDLVKSISNLEYNKAGNYFNSFSLLETKVQESSLKKLNNFLPSVLKNIDSNLEQKGQNLYSLNVYGDSFYFTFTQGVLKVTFLSLKKISVLFKKYKKISNSQSFISYYLQLYNQAKFDQLYELFLPNVKGEKDIKNIVSQKNLKQFYYILSYLVKQKQFFQERNSNETILDYSINGAGIFLVKNNDRYYFSPNTYDDIEKNYDKLYAKIFPLGFLFEKYSYFFLWEWIVFSVLLLIFLYFSFYIYRVSRRVKDKKIRNKFLWRVLCFLSFSFFVFISSFFEGISDIDLLYRIFYIILTLLFINSFFSLGSLLLSYSKEEGSSLKNYSNAIHIASKFINFFVILLSVVLILSFLGVNISNILAGLGIGGLAFALAAKDTLENIFGSLTILFDDIFNIGDYVEIDSVTGTIEDIGIRSTKVRTTLGSLVSVPNSNMIKAVVNNYSLRPYRRIRVTLGVIYSTPAHKIEAFCEGIRELIRNHPYLRSDFYNVNLHNFSSSSLDIMLNCYIKTSDWSIELRERQRLFLDIIRLSRELGIDFAFPTQTLHLVKNEQEIVEKLNEKQIEQEHTEAKGLAKKIINNSLADRKIPPNINFLDGDPYLK